MGATDWEAEQAKVEHLSTLSEWRQDKQTRKEKAAAAEQMFAKFIAEAFKEPSNKKNIGAEGLRSMKAGQRGEDPVREARINDQRFGGVVTAADFTGINEEVPWERD